MTEQQKERLCDLVAEALVPWMAGNGATRDHNARLAAEDVLGLFADPLGSFYAVTPNDHAEISAIRHNRDNDYPDEQAFQDWKRDSVPSHGVKSAFFAGLEHARYMERQFGRRDYSASLDTQRAPGIWRAEPERHPFHLVEEVCKICEAAPGNVNANERR